MTWVIYYGEPERGKTLSIFDPPPPIGNPSLVQDMVMEIESDAWYKAVAEGRIKPSSDRPRP